MRLGLRPWHAACQPRPFFPWWVGRQAGCPQVSYIVLKLLTEGFAGGGLPPRVFFEIEASLGSWAARCETVMEWEGRTAVLGTQTCYQSAGRWLCQHPVGLARACLFREKVWDGGLWGGF